MSTAPPHMRPFADLLRLFVPPGIWFMQFTTLYLVEALMCAPPIARPGGLIWISTAATIGALAALIAFAFVCRRTESVHDDASFLHDAVWWLTLVSGLAVIWTAFPLALLPVCAPLAD